MMMSSCDHKLLDVEGDPYPLCIVRFFKIVSEGY